MAWDGAKLKIITKERGVTLIKLSESLGVSRQTVNDWIKGQVPKGHHLIGLSSALDISPSYFFQTEVETNISLPLHRKRGVAKLTEEMKKDAFEMAKQYEKLFKEAPDPGLVQVLRIKQRDDDNARVLAKKLRELSGIEADKPLDYQHSFYLLSRLNIVSVFRDFPQSIKGYAFYCRIYNYRVVFVNNKTKVLDLIFPLLHETIHAIRDEESNLINDQKEEDFCDLVAGYVQFPPVYVKQVANTISGRRSNVQINLLKEFGRENHHSMFGIVEEIKKINPSFSLKIGGADTNLKKEFPAIGDVLFHSNDSRDYIELLGALSPLYIEILSRQINNATTRKMAEWLDLDNSLDGKQIVGELKRLNDKGD